MKEIPLLARGFKQHTPESFTEYVKSLHNPYKPEVKLKKRSTKNDNNSRSKPDPEGTRETQKNAGVE